MYRRNLVLIWMILYNVHFHCKKLKKLRQFLQMRVA